jgi:hypothetical protein
MSKLLKLMRRHKIISGIIGVFVVILVLVFVVSMFGVLRVNQGASFDTASIDSSYQKSGQETASYSADDSVDADVSRVEIQEGSVQIDTEDTAADEAEIRILTNSYNGYIEEGSQTETNTQLRTLLTARVLATDFTNYLEDIRTRFEVENYHVRNYRIEVEEQTTELDIIADTAAKYAAMKTELEQLPVNSERVRLLMEITDKELELKRQENRLSQEIDRIARRGDMATLRITLKERLSADIWPEDIGNEFRDQFRSVIDDVVNITIAIFTTSLVVFMTAIQWAAYLLIVLLVLWLAYRLLRRLYRRWNK